MDLCIGDRIRDNDPRMLIGGHYRTLTIESMNDRHVWAYQYTNGPRHRINRKRIFTDVKVRRSGFSRIGSK